MDDRIKIAVSPPIQVGGSLFTPEQLAVIGGLAAGGTRIEMTPFKQLYVEIPVANRQSVEAELERVGLEVNPSGFAVKSLIACNFCKGAEDAGLDTAKVLNRAVAGIETPTPIKIGYAGCALGTSEPLLKDIGVIKMRDTFDVFVGGEPKGLKAKTAIHLIAGLKEEELVPTVLAILDYYKSNAKGKEKFGKFVDRVTPESIRSCVKLTGA